MLIYIETISEKDSEIESPEWEKDLLYQQIYHKITLEEEFQMNKVSIYFFQ